MRRAPEAFELTIDVLDVRGEIATVVSPKYALVPIGLYADSIRYLDWLRQTIAPLAWPVAQVAASDHSDIHHVNCRYDRTRVTGLRITEPLP